MERRELGDNEHASRSQEDNTRWLHAWLPSLRLGFLIVTLVAAVTDNIFAQEDVPSGTKAAPGSGAGMPSTTQPSNREIEATSAEPAREQIETEAPKPVKVPEIVVKEARERKDSYTVDESGSAMRIPVPIHDTPRSIDVVTQQVLEDQKVIRFSEALRNVSGVSQSNNQGGQSGQVMIRGFASGLNIFKNGFRDDDVFGTRTQRDVINLERIEVVKGPPSYLYGRSDPGGIINQITKAPLRNHYYSAEMLIGSYGLYRPQFDIGGPLNASKTLTFRFNGMFESAGSYRDGVESTRTFLAPTIGWEIGPRTTLRVEGEYLYTRAPIDRGLVAIGGGVASIPISRFLGDPTRKNETNHGKATITLLHEFNDLFTWRTAFRSAVSRTRYSSRESWFFVGDENAGILNVAQFVIPTITQSHYLQNELHGKFSTGPIKHKTIIGVELGREVDVASVSSDFGGDTSNPGVVPFSFINIFNPADKLFLNTPLLKSSDTKTVNNILGVYFGNHVSLLENLHVHGGGRFDYFKQHLTNRPNDFDPIQTEDSQTKTAFSPSVGVTYQPWKPVALFANYTESFAPQTGGTRSFDGTLFEPERGKAYEGGVKFQFFENRLRAKIAAFHIKKKNVLTTDPINGFAFSVATGEQRSEGIEFDVAGRILPGWDVIANYAYIDTRVTADNSFLTGSRVPNTALNQGSLWTTYFIQDGPLRGLGGGLGMYAQGKRNGIFQCQTPGDCQQFELAGYVRMDAAVYYRRPEVFTRTNLLAAVNFTNVLDQRYFAGTLNIREVVDPGAAFTMIGSLKLEFQ
ncbi:MAG: TonB-dependent siderophore receptor [Nitrospira sp.]